MEVGAARLPDALHHGPALDLLEPVCLLLPLGFAFAGAAGAFGLGALGGLWG
jgi:hypothetical protein